LLRVKVLIASVDYEVEEHGDKLVKLLTAFGSRYLSPS